MELLNLVVPGAGVVASTLTYIYKLCQDLKAEKDACLRVHDRLKTILDELGAMKKRGTLPNSDGINKYTAMVGEFKAFLVGHREKKFWAQLLKRDEMKERLRMFHEDIDMVFRMLNLAGVDVMMDWRREYDTDMRNMERLLKEMVCDADTIKKELQGSKAQSEAIINLLYEGQEHADRQSAESLKLMKTLVQTVSEACHTPIRSLTPWFLPRDEVKFDAEPFAKGSFGAVHHGTWGSGTKIAVKCLSMNDTNFSKVDTMLFNEINIWYSLNHPHVIKMYGASHLTNPPFIVCEDAVHGNLATYLDIPANKPQMWPLLYQAAQGMDYLSRKKKVVHGDLKLNNILVGADGKAKIADFGMSVIRSASLSLSTAVSSSGASVGCNLRWRAPECMKRKPTFASDIYSFGMCIIEAATGEPPYSHLPNDDDVRYNLLNGILPEKPDELSDEAWALVREMTIVDRSKRCSWSYVLSKLKGFAQTKSNFEISDLLCSKCNQKVPPQARFVFCAAIV